MRVAYPRMRPPRGWVRGCLLAIFAGGIATSVSAQPVVRFARSWSTDSFGAEPLFRPVAMIAVAPCELWVSDAGSGVIYRYDCRGRALGRVGRKGEGPGEFNVPAPLARLRGDTVGVWDQRQQRLSLFHPSGRFLRSEKVELSPMRHGFVRGFGRAGATTVMHTDNYPTTEPRANERYSFFWPVSGDGKVGTALLRAPASQSLIDRSSAASTRLDAPFQRVPVALFTADGHVLVGNTGSRELSRFRYGPRMVPAGRLTLDLPALPVTRRDRRSWLDSVRTRLAQDRERSNLDPSAKASFVERHERLLDRVAFPRTRPYYTMAALDERNDLWLQLPTAGNGRARWQVRDGRSGRLLRTIELPTGNQVKAAAPRDGALYVVEVNPEGVAFVTRYAPPARVPARR